MRRGVAQLEARCVWDAEVGGSSPPTPTVVNHRKMKWILENTSIYYGKVQRLHILLVYYGVLETVM